MVNRIWEVVKRKVRQEEKERKEKPKREEKINAKLKREEKQKDAKQKEEKNKLFFNFIIYFLKQTQFPIFSYCIIFNTKQILIINHLNITTKTNYYIY